MPIPVVACAQQQMRLFESLEAYQKELSRFFYMVRAKGADLVVFPAFSGLMAVTPQVEETYTHLVRTSGERGIRSLLERTRQAMSGGPAAQLRSNYRKALQQALHSGGAAIRLAYENLYSGLAGSYRVTVIAGSLYLPDDAGIMRHRCTVFGPDGAAVGHHDAAILGEGEAGMAEPGLGWAPVDTPIGRVGIMLGQEVLYPEVARILAHDGADLLVTLGATTDETEADYLRHAAIARAVDNMVFGLSSFLVGANFVTVGDADPGAYVGRSGIYAPLEMTPRHTGVLVEMGTAVSEGLLTAEMDASAAHSLWDTSAAAVRRDMPASLFASLVPQLYAPPAPVPPQALPAPAEEPLLAGGAGPAAAEAEAVVTSEPPVEPELPDVTDSPAAPEQEALALPGEPRGTEWETKLEVPDDQPVAADPEDGEESSDEEDTRSRGGPEAAPSG